MDTAARQLLQALFSNVPGLVIDRAQFTDVQFVVTLRATAPFGTCPLCQEPSAHVHSRYQRTLMDLPWGGHPARILLRVHKFFCPNVSCPWRIFTERLPALEAPSARMTTRLADVLRAIALTLGGEAGARFSARIRIRASPTMLITTIRQIPLPTHPPPRVLGVDDSALRKGVRYGAALVDLEEHRLIDLLPDRTAESLAAWLQAHPGVAIITRDRNETYATGARQGAPDAIQVADRWHLLANWREVMVRLFERHRGPVKQVTTAQPRPLVAPAETLLPPKRVNRRRKYAEQRRAQVHAQRLARYAAVRGRYQAGAYLTTIARELKLNYKTARKYALADECPQLKAYPPRQRLLAPYEPYLRALGGWLSQRDAALP